MPYQRQNATQVSRGTFSGWLSIAFEAVVQKDTGATTYSVNAAANARFVSEGVPAEQRPPRGVHLFVQYLILNDWHEPPRHGPTKCCP